MTWTTAECKGRQRRLLSRNCPDQSLSGQPEQVFPFQTRAAVQLGFCGRVSVETRSTNKIRCSLLSVAISKYSVHAQGTVPDRGSFGPLCESFAVKLVEIQGGLPWQNAHVRQSTCVEASDTSKYLSSGSRTRAIKV